MATIKKAQAGAKTKDSTKTYQDSPFQKAKMDKEKKKVDYKKFESTKMKNGGSLSGLKASNKRVGSVDPKGAYTKVQEKTLAGAKGSAKLTKDKQLGATKMKAGGKMAKKK